MHSLMGTVTGIVHIIAEVIICLTEIAGISILAITFVKGLINYIQKKRRVAIGLAQGTTLALSFLMIGEVLHTAVASEWKEIATLGAIIVFRVALTVLLHWEIKHEEAHEALENKNEDEV